MRSDRQNEGVTERVEEEWRNGGQEGLEREGGKGGREEEFKRGREGPATCMVAGWCSAHKHAPTLGMKSRP